jgi:hypothetical protein
VRNGYTLRLLNKYGEARRFRLHIEALNGALLPIVGAPNDWDLPTLAIGPDPKLELRALITMPKDATPHGAVDIGFAVEDLKSTVTARARDHFFPR